MTGSGLNPTEWDPQQYKHQDITETIIASFYAVYNEAGSGFLESVYERAMAIALAHRGLDGQTAVSVAGLVSSGADRRFSSGSLDRRSGHGRTDRALERVNEAPLQNYLRACDVEVGLPLNFGPVPKIKRLVFANERKKRLRPSALICG